MSPTFNLLAAYGLNHFKSMLSYNYNFHESDMSFFNLKSHPFLTTASRKLNFGVPSGSSAGKCYVLFIKSGRVLHFSRYVLLLAALCFISLVWVVYAVLSKYYLSIYSEEDNCFQPSARQTKMNNVANLILTCNASFVALLYGILDTQFSQDLLKNLSKIFNCKTQEEPGESVENV